MSQLSMTGDDWLSDNDRKRQARAAAARRKAALRAAGKMRAAADALGEYVMACLDCYDGSGSRGADDGRTVLAGNLRELASWLDSVYGK